MKKWEQCGRHGSDCLYQSTVWSGGLSAEWLIQTVIYTPQAWWNHSQDVCESVVWYLAGHQLAVERWCPTGGAELDLLRSDLALGDGSWIGPLRGAYSIDWCHISVMEGCQERGARQGADGGVNIVDPHPPFSFWLMEWPCLGDGVTGDRCLAPTSRGQGVSSYL